MGAVATQQGVQFLKSENTHLRGSITVQPASCLTAFGSDQTSKSIANST